MSSSQQSEHLSLAGVLQPIFSKLAALEQLIRRQAEISDEMQQFGELLQTLPLSSEEYSQARNRWLNVRRYLDASESGAARWELTLLRSKLRTWLNAEAVEPRRRLRRRAR